ncbi:hypothetical protein BHE74_00003115 [Ensete ventricosum]|nr:hypothetical protein GW17_00002115 [Ensete ventricosum]RWW88028.1 hypothetical protein BHE74_00003115 [Ensete ventricosum]RZR75917.1 hypothetical protein BHM03_00000502 [Ensete ventricosum]
MNSFWTTSSCWFTWRNCAQRESAKPEERESGSGRLGTKALGMGVENPNMASGVLDLTSRGKRCPSASTWWVGSGSSQDVSVLGPIIWGCGCGSIDECANRGICGIIAYIIPVNACTWWVRPRKASTVIAGAVLWGGFYTLRAGDSRTLTLNADDFLSQAGSTTLLSLGASIDRSMSDDIAFQVSSLLL